MWRYGPGRGASSPEQLAAELHLQWVRQFPPLTPAWRGDARLQFDRFHAPVVTGKTLFVGSSVNDALLALDVATGAEKWRFRTDGPVRLAPAAANGKVYIASDDGRLYCLDAEAGTLIWKFRGGPAARRLIGNERVISVWPARGGPVTAEGAVYFAAGIWPFMGVFVYALDAETGQVRWRNSDSDSLYRVVDHDFWDYVGVSPQGSLAVVGEKLIVPCGRAWPAIFDRSTGKLLHFAQGQELPYTRDTTWHRPSWQGGNWRVAADSRYVFNMLPAGGRTHGGILDLATGGLVGMAWSSNLPGNVVLDGAAIYGADHRCVRALRNGEFKRTDAGEAKSPVGHAVRQVHVKLPELWNLPASGHALIKAGSRLYLGASKVVKAIDIPSPGAQPKVSWEAPVDGAVHELLAAAGRLFAVTAEGRLYCFGPDQAAPQRHGFAAAAPAAPPDEWSKRAAAVLRATGAATGYCVVLGADGRLAEELARQSELDVVVVDADADKVRALRERLDGAGLYGKRVSAFVASPSAPGLPPYMASLVVVPDAGVLEIDRPGAGLLSVLRPYGGTFCVSLGAERQAAFARWVAGAGVGGLETLRAGEFALARRSGPLPGAGAWTHEYRDAARTMASPDVLVKPPLGVLWFGGATDRTLLRPFFIPRYYPAPQVVGGRLFAQDLRTLYAADVYTGRLLWRASLPDPKDAYDTYRLRTPGYTAVSAADSVYVACGETCLRLDPATGKRTAELRLPGQGRGKEKPYWGFMAVWEDLLVASSAVPNRFWSSGYASVRGEELTTAELARIAEWLYAMTREGKLKAREGESRNALLDRVLNEVLTTKTLPEHFPKEARDALEKRLLLRMNANDRIVVMDRYGGEVLWEREASWGFTHINNQLGNPRFEAIALGAGKVFCLDSLPRHVVDMLKRRGEAPAAGPTLLALDVRTGKELWRTTGNMLGQQWVAYSAKHDVVLTGVYGSVCAFRGADGVELWRKHVPHNRSTIVHEDVLVTMLLRGDLTGKSLGKDYDSMYREWTMHDLLTGQEKGKFPAPGAFCGVASACRRMILFRSTSPAFYDLETGVVTSLPSFRSGCSINLIPADGVLSVPNYAWHCVCNYPICTSLALVHVPELAEWNPAPAQDERLSKRPGKGK